MKVPYIKIKQRSEVFYLAKFKASTLINAINFHFREPYSDFQSDAVLIKNEKYLADIKKKGIDIVATEEGIQRRLQIDRINGVKSYLQNDETNFLPNTVLISADISRNEDLETQVIKAESTTFGEFSFPDDFYFSIIDGQHRLGGMSLLDDKLLDEFEIPAIILFNVSTETAAKLFADINGKQKAVNKSLIYDLYSEVDTDNFKEIKKYHAICDLLYKSSKSPLYRQIKMLGVGSGSISQAFFIDYVKENIQKTELKNFDVQELFNHLFYYFKAYQSTFPSDWPVPEIFLNNEELEKYADEVLKVRKSQLVKTNGFGAIVRAFPRIYSLSKTYNDYKDLVAKQKGKVSWISKEVTGTGKALQNKILNDILDCYK